ncbi:DUF2163 domain-containing protein [Pseudorhodoplanes sp.]|uniref:DUF2163 domain-containing protein n=1 Tax=Pseudorhodoplanes sp. TaxID=1934341 RepID=UPI002D0C3626|nr:DUF2163 domain-containing protein [Pseudorhodoplanes sp.]HWV55567.1 DUF2163 domain-containing protein [Pseudorhodoplanes sp.]
MRTIPPLLQARLESGATTLCRCWIVTRRDGAVQGFTDHDRDVTLNEVVCRADSGFAGTEAIARLGLSVDGIEVSGVLSDESLNEDALAAGRYDAAQVDMYVVDWSEPSLHVLMSRGHVGEVRREGRAFAAELRGLADALNVETGRLYTAGCAADLGDARCGVDLDDPAWRGEGTVAALNGTSVFIANGLPAFDDGLFTGGRVLFTSGANAGDAMEVKRHRMQDDTVTIALWQAMAQPIAPGDTFVVTAGCDKRFATCRDRFDNVLNFRGFPHIPGNDFLMRYATDGEPGHDGQSLQR